MIDVTGQNGKTWFDRAGDFHSASLHVVERFTPRSADTLMYEATIEDPKVYLEAVENQHAALPSRGKERSTARIQVR